MSQPQGPYGLVVREHVGEMYRKAIGDVPVEPTLSILARKRTQVYGDPCCPLILALGGA